MRGQQGARRSWQPMSRETEADDGATAESNQDSSGSGASKNLDPGEPKSSRSDVDDPMPPDPWSTWLQRREYEGRLPRFQQGQGHFTFVPFRPHRYESIAGYDSSGGWLSAGELRNFNVAQVNRTTAMNNGRWAGSYMTRPTTRTEVLVVDTLGRAGI